MAMVIYDMFGSTVPTSVSNVDASCYNIGVRFRITSSIATSFFQPYTASVVGVKAYRGTLYTGPYTCSLWRVSDTTMIGTVCYIPPKVSETGWVSASFNPPISISLDTDYVITKYGFANAVVYSTLLATPYYSSSLVNPLVCIKPHYTASGSAANPAPPFYPAYQAGDNNWHGIDVVISASQIAFTGNPSLTSSPCVNGYMQGINLGGPVSINGDTPMGRSLQVGVSKNTVEGNPSAPCLSLDIPGFWRFKWIVKSGARSVSVSTKQNSTGSFRPSIVVKSNPEIGLNSDVSGSAADGVGWKTVGPVGFTSGGSGVVWVELHNNCAEFDTPALFDHIVVT